MAYSGESRSTMTAVLILVVVLLLAALSFGAVLLVAGGSRGAPAAGQANATLGSTNVAVTTAPSTPVSPTQAVVAVAQTLPPTAVVAAATAAGAAVPSPTTQPSSAPAPTSPPPTATPAPTNPPPTATPEPNTPAPTSAPASAPAPTQAPAAPKQVAIEWPDSLPEGMSFSMEDSWPFRTMSTPREREPFLIFRGGPRWLLVRQQSQQEQPIPRSATVDTVSVGSGTGTLIQYAGSGLKLVLKRDGYAVQLSTDGLSTEELTRIAQKMTALTLAELQARIDQGVAGKKLHVTLLWPESLPAGVALAPAETSLQLAQPVDGPLADRYRVSFRGAGKSVVVGGGSEAPPQIDGTEERLTAGAQTAVLLKGDRRFLLTIDGPAEGATLRYPAGDSSSSQMPLVQRGRVFVAVENVDRAEFDQIVAGLHALRIQEFTARARGQTSTVLAYRWPARLPDGFSVDLSSAKVSWDDFVLQGGLPFFELIATGPGGTTTIRGGRESGGQTLIVPEGPDVERQTASIHGQTASAARTQEGSIVVWSEENTLYSISSRTLPLEQLVPIGEGLQPIDEATFFSRLQ